MSDDLERTTNGDEKLVELKTGFQQSEAQAIVQSALTIAAARPRSEDAARTALMHSCGRTTFAEGVRYEFPRGGRTIDGPSVKLAREMARVWGNIGYGFEVIFDDDERIILRGWAVDYQSNTWARLEDSFKKLIMRKANRDAPATWVIPDERDLRELINRHGAILERNCILKITPPDLAEDALAKSAQTLLDRQKKDPDGTRKALLEAFDGLGVSAEMLEIHLGHEIKSCSPTELESLRAVYNSIKGGNSTWHEYTAPPKAPETATVPTPTIKAGELDRDDEEAKALSEQMAKARAALVALGPSGTDVLAVFDEGAVELRELRESEGPTTEPHTEYKFTRAPGSFTEGADPVPFFEKAAGEGPVFDDEAARIEREHQETGAQAQAIDDLILAAKEKEISEDDLRELVYASSLETKVLEELTPKDCQDMQIELGKEARRRRENREAEEDFHRERDDETHVAVDQEIKPIRKGSDL